MKGRLTKFHDLTPNLRPGTLLGMNARTYPYSKKLQNKLDLLKARRTPLVLQDLKFESPLFLAPMASICNAPFRLLMQDLGAGGIVSELISCDGLHHGNKKTRDMLRIDPREKYVGIQLFGEDPSKMAEAAKVAEGEGAAFIDINMGCPVKKVVGKGAGSALMRDPLKLAKYFSEIKKSIKIPLTVKMRTGWDQESRNALEIISLAREEGLSMVAVHGRTRVQAYKGEADWNFLENCAQNSSLPFLGNGDLNHPGIIQEKRMNSNCQGFMIGRGALRNPFIFLESENEDFESPLSPFFFTPADYLEVIEALDYYARGVYADRFLLIQMRKLIIWFAAGFNGAANFRKDLFKCQDIDQVKDLATRFFSSLTLRSKQINFAEGFLMGGHG